MRDAQNKPLQEGIYLCGKEDLVYLKQEGKNFIVQTSAGETRELVPEQSKTLYPIKDAKNYIKRLENKKVIFSISYQKVGKTQTMFFPKQFSLEANTKNMRIDQKISFIQNKLEEMAINP